jgi:hypothetical protein
VTKDTDFALDRLTWPEGPLIEKKTDGDHKDWAKTLVAFANSNLSPECAVLFIGASNIPPHRGIRSPNDIDTIQRRVAEIARERCYPPIEIRFVPLILKQEEGECHVLAVVVPASQSRPHFTGPAYIREGSRSRPASKEVFDELIASNNSVAAKILALKNRQTQWKLVASNGVYFLNNATVFGCTATSAQIRDDTTGFEHPIPLTDIALLERRGLLPILRIKYWSSDHDLMQLMIERWDVFANTQEPIYHRQIEYIRQQALLHARDFIDVTRHLIEQGNTSQPLSTLYEELRRKLDLPEAVLIGGPKRMHDMLRRTVIS